MPPRRSSTPKTVPPEDTIASLRYDATRKNNPPSGLAAQGRIAESPRSQYEYNPHLPPTLRFDATGKSDQLPPLLEIARQRALTADEAQQLANALRRHQPWLEWSGKREKPWFEVDPVALHIHERISTQAILKVLAREDIQRSLFADPEQEYYEAVQFYKHDVDWSNRLILGDSLQVMASLARREDLAGKVQMIYFDPPYGIKFASNFQPQLGQRDVKDRAQDLTREPEMVRAYRDTWTLGIHSYLAYLRDRLLLARDLLTDSGSLFVQISDENLHRVRMLLDEVFGAENFYAQINYRTMTALGSSGMSQVYDYILWYAKDKSIAKYRPIYDRTDISDDSEYSYVAASGASAQKLTQEEKSKWQNQETIFKRSDLNSSGYTPSCVFAFEFQNRICKPSSAKSWRTNPEGMIRLINSERLFMLGDKPYARQYLGDFGCQNLENSWHDTAAGFSERKLYVVQTNTKTIERCLLMTTDPGDLVLDPTCGSGTTAYVAEQWGRRWISMDTSRVALALARQRLMTARFPFFKLRTLSAEDVERNPQGVWLRDPRGEVTGKATFQCKTVPHVTLKSIARNASLDPIFAKHEAILAEKLATLNAALQNVPPDLRTRLAAKLAAKEKREGKKSISDADKRRWLLPTAKPLPSPPLQREGTVPPLNRGRLGGGEWEHWQVPFDTDPDWTPDLQSALTDYRAAWRAKMDEVNDCIAKNATLEELVDKPEELKNVVRVSGPFTVEGVMALEEGPDSPIADAPAEHLESFANTENNNAESIKHDPLTVNAEAHLDQMLRLLRAAGVDFKGNQNVKFNRLEAISGAGFIHFEGEWINREGELRTVGVSIGPEVGNVSDYQVQDALFLARKRAADDLLFAGFGFDAAAQATIEDDANPRVRLHMALIRPDVAMSDLLKTQPGSQIFTIFSAPRVAAPIQQNDGQWTVEVEGMDIYDPVSNQLFPSNKEQIAAWFLDSDYDGRIFCICQAFFPNKANWEKLAKALGNSGVVEEGAFDALSGLRSLAFGRSKRLRANERWQVAVKVIDPRGNEGLRVLNMDWVAGGEVRYR